jgi:hypothetical protein
MCFYYKLKLNFKYSISNIYNNKYKRHNIIPKTSYNMFNFSFVLVPSVSEL